MSSPSIRMPSPNDPAASSLRAEGAVASRVPWVFWLAGAAAVAVTAGLVAAPVARAEASCPYGPNIYAGATNTDNGGSHYGVRGYIKSYNLSGVTQVNHHFSAQHFTAIGSPDGIEVGWYIGWGEETGTYVISPHAYVSENPIHELDGPAVGASDDWYSTYWSGSTQVWNVRQTEGGTLIWGSSQPAYESGPGTVVALGEVNDASLPMEGEYQGVPELQFYSGTGAWDPWKGLSLCADSGFSSSGNVDDVVDN